MPFKSSEVQARLMTSLDHHNDFLNLPSPFHSSSRDSRSPPSISPRTSTSSWWKLSSIPEQGEEIDEGLLAQEERGWGWEEVRNRRRRKMQLAVEVLGLFLAVVALVGLMILCVRGMRRGVMDRMGGGH